MSVPFRSSMSTSKVLLVTQWWLAHHLNRLSDLASIFQPIFQKQRLIHVLIFHNLPIFQNRPQFSMASAASWWSRGHHGITSYASSVEVCSPSCVAAQDLRLRVQWTVALQAIPGIGGPLESPAGMIRWMFAVNYMIYIYIQLSLNLSMDICCVHMYVYNIYIYIVVYIYIYYLYICVYIYVMWLHIYLCVVQGNMASATARTRSWDVIPWGDLHDILPRF